MVWVTPARAVLQWVDDGFLQLMEWLRFGPAVKVAEGLAFLGGVWCTWVIRGVVAAVLVRRRHWVHLTAFVLAVTTSEMLIGVLKERVRPGPAGGESHRHVGGLVPVGARHRRRGHGRRIW